MTVVAGLTGCERADAPVARGTRASRGHGARGRCRAARGDPRRVGVGSRRRGAGGGAAGDRRGARGRAARADGDPLRRARAVRPPRARAARCRRHHAQRRGGAHARRQRAGTWAAGPPCAPRSRLPAPRRHAPARLGTRVPSRSARPRNPLGEDQPRRRDRARRRSMAPAARAVRPHPGARAGGGAGGHRPRPPPRALRGRARPRRASCRPSSPPWSTTSRSTPPPGGRSSPPGPRGSCATIWRRRPAGPTGPRWNAKRPRRSRPRWPGWRGSTRSRPRPGVAVFRRTLELELDADLGRVGRLGDGLLLGHVALGLGLDLDRVFVCGLAEGLFPTRVRDDSLLPDADRRATDGALALRSARVDDDHRRLLAALASASQERILLFPRGDLRRTTERVPSRFLVESLAAVSTGASPRRSRRAPRRLVHAGAVVRGRARARRVPRHRAGAPAPHAARPRPGRRRGHHARAARRRRRVAHAASTRVVARRGRDFTRFDGNLAGCDAGRVTDGDVVVSPTRLQTYAANPFEYFLDYVLRVDIPELPEERYEVSPLDRGSLVHETLDAFLSEVLERPGGAPAPEEPWTDADRDRLREIAEARCGGLRGAGAHRPPAVLAPRPATAPRRARPVPQRGHEGTRRLRSPHHRHRAALRLPRRRAGRRPRALRRPRAAVPRRRRPGRPHRRRRPLGDRLQDRPPERRRPRATRPRPARMLQLPVYAHAARASFGDPDTAVGAAYWFVSTRGQFRWAELVLSPEVDARVDEVLRVIVDGIDAGVFPCRVDPPDDRGPGRCRSYTDPDARGTRDRYREWQRKRVAPALRGYVALAEPEVLDDDTDGELEERGDAVERPSVACTDAVQQSFLDLDEDLATRDAIVDDARRDAVRRSRRGLGQDQGARRPRRRAGDPARRADARDRRRHVHREGGGRAARPDPARARGRGPRRRGGRRGSGHARARRARRRRGVHPARVRAAAPHRAPDRGRASRRASRCSTTSRRSSRSRSAGRASSTSCSTTPRSSARCSSRSTPTPPSTSCARWRWRATRTGTSSPSAWDPSPTRRRSTVALAPVLAALDRAARARRALPGGRRQAARDCSASLAAWHERARRRARRVRAAAPPHRGHAEGQRHARAARTTGPRRARWTSVRDRVKALRLLVDETAAKLAEVVAAAPGVGARAVHAARGRGAPPPAGSSSSTTCSCSPARCCATRSTAGTCAARLRARYQRLLLDEFQDTDPIQVRARRAARRPATPTTRDAPLGRDRRSTRAACSSSATPSSRSTGSGAPTSPRSSAAALRVRRRAAPPHRATSAPPAPVLDFVNHVFRELIVAEPESQPEYVALEPRARGRAGRAAGACCSASSPTSRRSRTADELREREARRRRRGRRRARCARAGRCRARHRRHRAVGAPCRLGDICILLPARTSLGHLEDALDAAGIPYRAETSLARLRHPRDPRPARRAAGGRRPHRRARARERAALAAVRLRRRRPLHVPRRARRPLEPPARPCRRRCRPTIRSATRCGVLGRVARRPAVARRRASCSTASCASGACSRSASPTAGFRDVVAARALRVDQARAFVGRRRAAALRDFLAWADAPGQRGRAGRRDRAARDRRRRGAHPDHPRRQGARVPDHDRVGHDHQGAAARRAACSCCFPHDRDTYAVRLVDAGHRPRSSSATRRSTSRWTSTRSCGSSTWP